MKNFKELSDIFTKSGDLQSATDKEEVELLYCSEQDELDMDPYGLMYNLFREIVEC